MCLFRKAGVVMENYLHLLLESPLSERKKREKKYQKLHSMSVFSFYVLAFLFSSWPLPPVTLASVCYLVSSSDWPFKFACRCEKICLYLCSWFWLGKLFTERILWREGTFLFAVGYWLPSMQVSVLDKLLLSVFMLTILH